MQRCEGESACSEDPPSSQGCVSAYNEQASCFCAAPVASKTASHTITGRWWKTGAAAADASCSDTVLYLGEINDSQKEQWIRAIEVFDEEGGGPAQLELFPRNADCQRARPMACRCACASLSCIGRGNGVRAGCSPSCGSNWSWMGFGASASGLARGHRWEHVLQTLCFYRLIDPGSEWRLHRQWFEHSAMADLLGEDFALAAKDTLYRCLDQLLEHKRALFDHLQRGGRISSGRSSRCCSTI